MGSLSAKNASKKFSRLGTFKQACNNRQILGNHERMGITRKCNSLAYTILCLFAGTLGATQVDIVPVLVGVID